MQVKKLVSMTSRTGRDLQRYNLGCRQVVGCIPWRFRKNDKSLSSNGTIVDELEFLLISSQKSPKWMFPKGGWELDESMEEAAIRETMEEAGVLGEVGVQLGGVWSFKSKSQDCFHEGYMFAFEVKEELDVWPEKDVRQRLWLSASEAREKCVHQWMKEALDVFLCQLTELQRMKEEPQTPSLFNFFVAEEPRTTGGAQGGKEEGINYHLLPLTHLQRKEEQRQMPYLFDLFTAEEPMIGIVAQSGPVEDINYHLVPFAHLEIKEESRLTCSIEFLRTDETRIGKVAQSGEEEVASRLVS